MKGKQMIYWLRSQYSNDDNLGTHIDLQTSKDERG